MNLILMAKLHKIEIKQLLNARSEFNDAVINRMMFS